MDLSPFFMIFSLFLASSPSSSATLFHTLTKGSSLSVENLDDVLISPNGVFSAGFHSVGHNAFCFAIWFTKSSGPTVVWMANRDEPVNGRGSKFSLLKTGNLILTDAGRVTIWTTDTGSSTASVKLDLLNNGNLVLHSSENNSTLWQSYDSPTDTLLPQQLLTRDRTLISSRSLNNFSSGFYKLYFDNDNIIRLLFNGPEISSVYWPDPGLVSWQVGRTTYNDSRIAVLNSLGNFSSSDDFGFMAADFGMGPQRRLTLDFDGNLRLYSLEERTKSWVVSWQVISQPCNIHGICGPNSLCSYIPESGRKCSCIPGYKIINLTDWSYGCEPEFNLPCNNSDQTGFLQLPYVESYGYDYGFFPGYTFERCKSLCLQLCECKAFLLKFSWSSPSSNYNCYPKTRLLNGFRSSNFDGTLYLKLPKSSLVKYQEPEEFRLNCSVEAHVITLDRNYEKNHENGSLKFLLWFACSLGGVEVACIFLIWCFLFRTHQDSNAVMQGYLLAATGFKKFTYAELKKATRRFSEEIGRGGAGVLYKGKLSDDRVAAIKRLNNANQGEAEFLAEVSTIGKLNHMNLIEMWGYCAEGKHRLLVFEYMEHGSLADNLCSNELNWEKRFEIALGTAKGLAYLHEECLEWVLHCDVKPHNILLGANYHPKVADFGLSKLLNRTGLDNSSFSRIRGTRGYMAPEWVFNLPITSKVDVYSYGIVVLEMLTGKSVMMGVHGGEGEGETTLHRRLVAWVREKMNEAPTKASWMEEIVDPTMEGKYAANKMEILIGVALQCVEEDKDARPSMSQVVEKLQSNEDDEQHNIQRPSKR